MAIHHLTPPVSGGERSRSPSLQRGPVTVALSVMRAADPERECILDLRRRIAERIEADIALLDALDGDADAEWSLGSINAASYSDWTNQEQWSLGGDGDREDGDDNGLADQGGLEEQLCRPALSHGRSL